MTDTLFFTVLHRQWLMLGFAGGLVFVLGIWLFYLAGWRPRREKAESALPLTGLRQWTGWLLTTIPWILLVTFLGIAIWTFLYPILKVQNPPNW